MMLDFFQGSSSYSLAGSRGTDHLDGLRDLRLLCNICETCYNTGSMAFLRDSPAEIQTESLHCYSGFSLFVGPELHFFSPGD